jgi:hypothetical protein
MKKLFLFFLLVLTSCATSANFAPGGRFVMSPVDGVGEVFLDQETGLEWVTRPAKEELMWHQIKMPPDWRLPTKKEWERIAVPFVPGEGKLLPTTYLGESVPGLEEPWAGQASQGSLSLWFWAGSGEIINAYTGLFDHGLRARVWMVRNQ